MQNLFPSLTWLAKLARTRCRWNCVHGLRPTGDGRLMRRKALLESQAASLFLGCCFSDACHSSGAAGRTSKGENYRNTMAAQSFNPLNTIKIERLDNKTRDSWTIFKTKQETKFPRESQTSWLGEPPIATNRMWNQHLDGREKEIMELHLMDLRTGES